jgi:hypothetical protein
MKPLEQNEIFNNLNSFLKTRGIELKDGTYAVGIQKSCEFLTNAINLGQQSWKRARTEMDKSLDQMRQAIHQRTAPRSAKTASARKSSAKPGRASASGKSKSGSKKKAGAKRG